MTPPLKRAVRAQDAHHPYSSPYRLKKNSAFGGKCQCLSPSVCGHTQNIGKNVLLIVAKCPYCPIFLYIFLFVLPYEIREKIFEGTPPPGPPPALKNQTPPAEQIIGPPPLGFWSLPTYGDEL